MKRRRSWILAFVATLASCLGNSPSPEKPPSESPPGTEPEVCTTDIGLRVLRRLSAWEFERTLSDIFALDEADWLGVRLGADPLSEHGFTNDANLLLVGEQTANDILATAEEVADLVVDNAYLPTLLPCASEPLNDSCVAEFISTYGRRLYRRSLSDEEQLEYQALYGSVRDQQNETTGLKWTLVALIQSPHAVYRSELGLPDGDRFRLTQHELATELAYAFTGTTPSTDLLDKADRGELDSEEAVLAEAQSLLETPRGRQAVHRLLQEWSGYATIQGKAKDHVEDFKSTSEFMTEETRLFLDDVLIEQKGGVPELLTASHTYVNKELATFYGFADDETTFGTDFQKFERPTNWGIGLLAQGSMLSAYAHMGSSSPTLRGLFVFRRLLCQETEVPDDLELPPLPEPAPGVTTTRERYESIHAAAPKCSSCHDSFDPTGFALEHFDEAGRYRATEHGLTIDPSGHIAFKQTDFTTISGAVELAQSLATAEETSSCVSKLFAHYIYGASPCTNDAMDQAQQKLFAGDYGLVEYLVRLTSTPHFYYRKP